MKKRLDWLMLHRKWWLSVIAAVLVFWGTLWALVPGWVKKEIEGQATQALGRKVSVERVNFQPWAMVLEVGGLQIADAQGKDWQFKVESLRANLELSSIVHMAPVVDELVVSKPAFRLRHQGKGIYDVDDLIQRFAVEPGTPATEPAKFSVYNIHISGGLLDFVDVPVGKTHEIRELEFSLPFISSLPSQREVRVAPHLALKLNGHAVDLQAQATPFSSSKQAELHLVMPSVNIQHWLPYWPVQLAYKPVQGQLHADLKLKFVQGDKNKSDQIQLDGKLGLKAWQWMVTRGVLSGTGMTGDALELSAHQLGWPLLKTTGADKPGLQLNSDWPRLAGKTASQIPSVQAYPSATANAGRLSLSLFPQPQSGEFELKLSDANLQALHPFAGQFLEPRLSGRLSAALSGTWQGAGSKELSVQVKASELTVDDLLLDTRQARPLASGKSMTSAQGSAREASAVSTSLPIGWKQLHVRNIDLAWPLNIIHVGEIELTNPQMEFSRDAQGNGNWQQWVKRPSDPTEAPGVPSPDIKLDKLVVKGGQLVWWDAAATGVLTDDQEHDRGTARIELTNLGVQMQNLELSAGALVSRVVPFDVQANVGQISRQQKVVPGSLKIKGDMSGTRRGKKPPLLEVKATLDAQRIPLHALEPYLRARMHMNLLQADASVKGQVLYRQAQDHSEPEEIWLKGDAALENLRANSLEPAEELLSWKSLAWQGLEFHDTLDQPMVVRVGSSTLSDFYARLIISETGRFNLQDVFGKKVRKTGHEVAASPLAAASATATASVVHQTEPHADIYIGPSKLVNGRINFSDRFIKPNYSAALSELNGHLGGFTSQTKDGQVQMADMDLDGKVQGSALLSLKGKLNPLAKPLALDIKANVRDLELPPLSPYTAKYLGYAIERGKLNVDLSYQVQPDGRLVANNNFILNQLTLGEKIEGQGGNLPVKLAISLLKDRNGMIDVNLPVSGSLDDPDFKVGSIVWKLVLNLIGRALTSPFSLIASAFGGSAADQAGQVHFEAGSDRLTAESARQLEQIAKAMLDRPALRINLAGESSGLGEKAAYQRTNLLATVLADHLRRNPDARVTSSLELSRTEYEHSLKSVYAASKVKKPRNLIGLVKDIPAAEMEALLMESTPLGEDTWRQLALNRAQQVKDLLFKSGVPLERLFIVPPLLQGSTAVRLTLTLD